MGERVDLGQLVVGLMRHRDVCRVAHYEMGFDWQVAQQLEQPDAENDARRAADADYQPLCFGHKNTTFKGRGIRPREGEHIPLGPRVQSALASIAQS